MRRVSVLCVLLFVFSGCANNYAKFYNDLSGGMNVFENSNLVVPTTTPILIQGSDVQNDTARMREDGYMLLGYSSFNAGPVNQSGAISQAKKVHADTAIVYSRYTGTISGSMPIMMPDQQTTYHSGSIYGSGGGYANYQGSSTTYGTRTMYMPYSVNRLDYYATYWIKVKQFSLGVSIDNLTDELRKSIESNKGVYITVVVKGSPAFDNNLLVGDIIRRINSVEVSDGSHFVELIAQNKGRQIELEIVRADKTIVKHIQLN